jgi:long-chain acyl-CoA synthetase
MSLNNNVISEFFDNAKKFKDLPCAHFKSGDEWVSKSWSEVSSQIRAFSLALINLGLEKGDSVIIFAKTRLEWAIADFAIMGARGVCVPVYQTFGAERVAHIMRETNAKMAIVEDSDLAEVLARALGRQSLADSHNAKSKNGNGFRVISMDPVDTLTSMDDLISSHMDGSPDILEDRLADISPEDVATCVYTSGTTGELKGALITHGNISAEIEGTKKVFLFGPEDIGLLWLPLAHVLGRMMEIYGFVQGTQTAFTSDVGRLPEIYREIKPHFVCGVPRMLEKVHEQVMDHTRQAGVIMRTIFAWALRVGRKRSKYIQRQLPLPFLFSIGLHLADILVFRKLKARLGGRLWCFICGGAKLSEEVAKFFHSAGISVLEGYGLTETFAAATVNRLDDFHFGTVGKPINGVEIRIAPDGEVLIKGPIVFKGYIGRPLETKESFDRDGWFKTGDLGEYSRDGFLRIVGRKKEIIITAGGKNVAPQMIESMLVAIPYVEQAMVYGDGRKYLTALVTLNETVLKGCTKENDATNDSSAAVFAARAHIEDAIIAINKKLAGYETIKRFAIIGKPFSIAGGELTPTLKLRRKIISEKYAQLIESMY